MKKKSKVGFILLTVVSVVYMIIYIVWRAFFTLPDVETYGWFALILGIALLLAETMSALEAFRNYADVNAQREPEMPDVPWSWYPDVDVFIATHNEDEDILFKTGNACTYMEYPDKSKVHIYFCDDGNRPSVEKLAQKLGIGYIGLAENKEAKAGNLNNALSKTNSPLVVTFDADMIPNKEFLMETVPYFFLPKMKKDENGKWVEKTEDEIDPDEKIGFIQTPQSFYNADLFQYNLYSEGKIPNEQDYFFRLVNIGRNKSNSPIYAGSNTVISREALEEVGGIATGTITEDFETGLLIEAKGYRCYAISKLLAKGLAPITVPGLIKQRERWARGCVYSLRKVHLILNKNIPWKLKFSYMACRSYWNSFIRRFIFISCPILFVLLGIPSVVCGLKELLLIWLPTYALYAITLKAITGNIRSSRWSNIIDTILFPYLILPILAEFFCIHMKKFNVTSKKQTEDKNSDFVLALPHLILFILSVVALVISVRDAIIYEAFGGIIIIYWLVVNSLSLLMAIFFMLGRKNMRSTERFFGNALVELYHKEDKYNMITMDLSEGGFCAVSKQAVYLPEDETYDLCIREKGYEAKMKVQVASVSEKKGLGWKYGLKIVEIDDKNKLEYFQMIYDREHTLPKKISRSSSSYGDVVANVKGRIGKAADSNRKQVRLFVDKSYPLKSGGSVKILNYNFEYILLEGADKRKELTIVFGKKLEMKCKREKEDLYRIENIEVLMENPKFQKIVEEWNHYETIKA